MSNDFEVWKGKDLSQLFRDIYNNQRTTQTQITVLVDALKPLIKTAGDAAVIVPLIRDYLDVSVKNDSHIVRLAAIVERLYAAEILSSGDGDQLLTEEERTKLLETANEEIKQIRGGHDEVQKTLETSIADVKQLVKGSTETEELED
jgi:hypothetical protein